jgi:hypothetical protein
VAPERGHGLARHESRVSGQLVDEPEPAANVLRRVDRHGQDRNVAAQRPEALAMRPMVAVEAPDAAEGCGTGGAVLAQPLDQRHVQRAPAVLRRLGGVDHQLLPRLGGAVRRARLGQHGPPLAIALEHTHALQGQQRPLEQVPELRHD